jgi:hypothetical protein
MKRAIGVKTTRITIETETRVIVRRAQATLSWCPGCRAEVEVITLDRDSLVESPPQLRFTSGRPQAGCTFRSRLTGRPRFA